MFDHDPDKARTSSFSLDGLENVKESTFFSIADALGSIAPSQLSKDPHNMDWTPTPTGHASAFRHTHTHHHHHHHQIHLHDQTDSIRFHQFESSQPESAPVGNLVAQFEKTHAPSYPPRPSNNNAPSPTETNHSLTNSSFSSYFDRQGNQLSSPVGSPVDSQYSSFGHVLSRMASPQDMSRIESSSPIVTFGSVPDAHILNPRANVVRSNIPGLSQLPTVEHFRASHDNNSKNNTNADLVDRDAHLFGQVEHNIITFLNNDIDGRHRSSHQQPQYLNSQQNHQTIQQGTQRPHPQGTDEPTHQTEYCFHQQMNRQAKPQSCSSTIPQRPSPQLHRASTFQVNQQHTPLLTRSMSVQANPHHHTLSGHEPPYLAHQQFFLDSSQPQSTQTKQQQCLPLQAPAKNQSVQGSTKSSNSIGTPGFSIWRPPASSELEQEPAATSFLFLSKSLPEKPLVSPKRKPIQAGGSQIVLNFNSSSTAKAKGKTAVKPPRPPKPPRSKFFSMPAHSKPNDSISTSNSKSEQSRATPPATTMAASPGHSTLKQAVSALRAHAGLRPGRELLPAEAWEQHKPTIRSLYLDQRKPLKEVMSIMAEKHGFQATPKMYKTRFSQWGFVKNNTEDEVKKLLSMKFQRDAEGKISEFVRNGRVVNLGTYLKRKGVTEYDLIDFEQPADLPAHIRCRTPTPPPAPAYFQAPDLIRAQELLIGNIRKAFLHCRQVEVNSNTQVGWTSLQAWGAWSSDLLLEANFFFEALDADTGGQCLMRAFKQLEEDLKTLSPQGILELLSGMVNRDLGLTTALSKYLSAHSTTNLDRSHPLRIIFGCLYDVQQKHGAGIVSELLWTCLPLFVNELEAIYGRQHPYVSRAWLDLAFFNNHVNGDRLQKIAQELRTVQKQLEQKAGSTDPEVLVIRYAILQMMYVTDPQSDDAKHATTEVWHTLKSMNVLFRIRDSKANAYCYHSPVRLNPWTKRCRRQYDAAVAIFEDHIGVKLHPYFEEDLHTWQHDLDSHDSWATAMDQNSGSNRIGYI